MPPRARSPRLRLLLRGLLLLLALPLAGELWARYRVGYGNPRRIVSSRALGYRLEGGQSIDGPRGAREEINARGYRDREWPTQPPAGVRVVVLGDTAAYSQGVDVEASWPRLVEGELLQRGHEVTVFRMAVPGYTVEQMVTTYEMDGRQLEPQLVVVELAPTSVRPMLVLNEPERFPLEGVLRHSALYDWFRRSWLVTRAGEGLAGERRVLNDPYDPANDALWDVARARLDGLANELAARGARLVLLAAPRLEALLDPAGQDARWRAWCADRGVPWLDATEELRAVMRPLLDEVGAQGLDPARVWNRDTDVDHLEPEHLDAACFRPDDPVHLDERGHAAVARAVLPALEELLPPPGTSAR